METCLKQFRQVVVLRRADKARYRRASQRTGTGVEVIEKDAEGVWIEFDNRELSLG